MFRRRRPLLRAAAVGGGAYALGSRHARGQQQEADQNQQIEELQSQAQAPAPAPAAAPASGGISSDAVEKLQQLAKLHEQGVLTDEEFTAQKERLLA
jgi:ParB-like chromosome segregation protein Spo0J